MKTVLESGPKIFISHTVWIHPVVYQQTDTFARENIPELRKSVKFKILLLYENVLYPVPPPPGYLLWHLKGILSWGS